MMLQIEALDPNFPGQLQPGQAWHGHVGDYQIIRFRILHMLPIMFPVAKPAKAPSYDLWSSDRNSSILR